MKQFNVVYQKKGEIFKQQLTAQQVQLLHEECTIIKCTARISLKQVFLKEKINQKEFIVLLNEIEMILRSNLSLHQAIDIVTKSIQNNTLRAMFTQIQIALKNGQPLYEQLQPFKQELDPIIISFFKILHIKGEASLVIKALCDVLNTKKSNKELVIAQLSYPCIILCSFIVAMAIIFNAVIPKFEHIFVQYNLNLPLYTSSLLGVKNFFVHYSAILLGLIPGIYIALRYAFKQKKGRYIMDKIIVTRIPVVSQVYIYYEMYNLFLGLKVLHQSNYEFNVALENASLLLKNKYLLDKIQNIYRYIQSGSPVYEAFAKVELFDDLVLNLINSAQMTSNMNEALEKIEEYYKYKFTNSIKRFSSLIEPLFFVIMMLLILWVMLAIFTPIWNMSEMINL